VVLANERYECAKSPAQLRYFYHISNYGINHLKRHAINLNNIYLRSWSFVDDFHISNDIASGKEHSLKVPVRSSRYLCLYVCVYVRIWCKSSQFANCNTVKLTKQTYSYIFSAIPTTTWDESILSNIFKTTKFIKVIFSKFSLFTVRS